jgi:hypothetical protein
VAGENAVVDVARDTLCGMVTDARRLWARPRGGFLRLDNKHLCQKTGIIDAVRSSAARVLSQPKGTKGTLQGK